MKNIVRQKIEKEKHILDLFEWQRKTMGAHAKKIKMIV
jgi:hypothetical protein